MRGMFPLLLESDFFFDVCKFPDRFQKIGFTLWKVNSTRGEVNYCQTGGVLHSSFCHRINQSHTANSSWKNKKTFHLIPMLILTSQSKQKLLTDSIFHSFELSLCIRHASQNIVPAILYSMDESRIGSLRLGNSYLDSFCNSSTQSPNFSRTNERIKEEVPMAAPRLVMECSTFIGMYAQIMHAVLIDMQCTVLLNH